MKQVLAVFLLAVVAGTAHVAEAKRFIASSTTTSRTFYPWWLR